MNKLGIAALVVTAAAGAAILVWSGRSEARDADDDDEDAPAVSSAAVQERAAPVAQTGKAITFNFDAETSGSVPKGFHVGLTGGGAPPQWLVRADDSAPSKPNVVVQTSADPTDYRFPLLVADDVSFRDLELSVRFKAISGTVDQAAGLVFRLKDANNYYVVRANALEDNYRLYHVVAGRRVQFAGANAKVTSGTWHELRVEAVGNKFACYIDGVKKIEATDDTFKDAGKIGVWTKADSVTYFDDLRVVAK